MQNIELLRGAIGAQVNTRIVQLDGTRVHVNAVGELEAVEPAPGKLSVKLRYYPGETTALMLASVPGKPVDVRIGGQPAASMDWSYEQGVVLIRATADGDGFTNVDVAFR